MSRMRTRPERIRPAPGAPRRCLPALAMLLALCSAVASATSPSLDALLAEADALRTADPQRVDRLIGEIEKRVPSATPSQLVRVRMLRAHRAMTSGASEAAVFELRQILTESNDAATRFQAASMLANTQAILRNFEDALRALDTALPLAPQIEDRDLRHRGLMVAAIVYNQVGEYALAKRYAETVAADQPVARTRCAIASVTLEARNGLKMPFDDATAEQGLAQCRGEPIFAGFVRWHFARRMGDSGRGPEAIALLEGSLPEIEATGYPFLIAQYHALLAELTLASRNLQSAQRHVDRALAISGDAMSTEAIVKAHYVAYQLALRNGGEAAALPAYIRFAQAERTHFNDIKSREMAYQVVRQQSAQQAQQIELLHRKNQVLELEQRVAEQRARSWLLLAFLLAGVIATVGAWAWKIKRMQLRLKRMTQTDALTGLFNRQYFSECVEAALLQCEREGRPATLVMFDLDHFKQVNDRYGHAAGDWALRGVATAIQPLCRPVDAFGRLGGEEFAVFLPGFDTAAGVRFAQDAQMRLAALDSGSSGYGFRLAASFGVAEAQAGTYALADLLSQADEAMYAAKHGGRRQVRTYAPRKPVVAGATPAVVPLELVRDLARDQAGPVGAASGRAIA